MPASMSMRSNSIVSGLSTASRYSTKSVTSVVSLTTTVEERTGIRIPILQDAVITNVQRGSVFAAAYSIIEGLFSIITGIFDIHALSLAAPGSEHFGYYLFSYDFVYVGNPHVRNSLILFGALTAVGGVALIGTSIMLLQGLRKMETQSTFGFNSRPTTPGARSTASSTLIP